MLTVISVSSSVRAGGLTTFRPELMTPSCTLGLSAQILGFPAHFVGVPDEVANFIPCRGFGVPSHPDQIAGKNRAC
jgi:hypothetical protein